MKNIMVYLRAYTTEIKLLAWYNDNSDGNDNNESLYDDNSDATIITGMQMIKVMYVMSQYSLL